MTFDARCVNDFFSLSMIYGTGVLGSWYLPGVGVGSSGKEIGSGIVGASSFLRNLQFRQVILSDPLTLIRYWWLERVSIIRPVVSLRRVLWHCIEAICPF